MKGAKCLLNIKHLNMLGTLRKISLKLVAHILLLKQSPIFRMNVAQLLLYDFVQGVPLKHSTGMFP